MPYARKFAVLFWILSAASPAMSAPATGPAIDMTLIKTIRKELGTMRGSYYLPNRLVSEQILMGIGKDMPEVPLADGNWLISGCRWHSCIEKAALIVTPSGEMLAAALINFHCDPCTRAPVLTLLTKQKNNQPAVLRALQDWAHDVIAADIKNYGARNVEEISGTETRIIPERPGRATH